MKPDFHAVQYYIAGLLALTGVVAYCFAPESRAQGLLSITLTLVGFLVGKFSNGFGSKGGRT
jgi:hypothetical protein